MLWVSKTKPREVEVLADLRPWPRPKGRETLGGPGHSGSLELCAEPVCNAREVCPQVRGLASAATASSKEGGKQGHEPVSAKARPEGERRGQPTHSEPIIYSVLYSY